MKSEVWRKGDTGHNVEEQRHETVQDGTRVGTATNSSTTSVVKTAHLELDKN